MLQRILSSKTFLRLIGAMIAAYIRFVKKTSSIILDPPDLIEKNLPDAPLIMAMWHGQGLLLPFIRPRDDIKVAIMVARHIDGDIVNEAIGHFGMSTIRGSGSGRSGKDKGGFAALRACMMGLREGTTIAITADIPPGPARRASPGLPILSRLSGRPILPCAAVTKRYLKLNTWSGFTIFLPFSTMVITVGEQIRVPRHASDEEIEVFRVKLENALNETVKHAYAVAGTRERGIATEEDPVAYGPVLRAYVRLTQLFQPAAGILLRYRERRGKEESGRIPERLGLPSARRPTGPLAWLHAASVGETIAVLNLIDRLLDEHGHLQIVLTTGTVTSAGLASRRLPKSRVVHQYIPLDAPDFMTRFFDHWRPDVIVLTESEIWPNLIRVARLRKVPLVLINGRISPRSFRRWRGRVKLARQLFSKLDLVLAQNGRYAGYFERLGTINVIAAGNLKTDAAPPPADAAELRRMKKTFQKRPLFLAVSTHSGEDEIIAQAHEALKKEFNNLLTIIVPRHPERGPDICASMKFRQLSCALRSRNKSPGSSDIYIADTIGELGIFYALCPIAFIGGSLVPHGGQNPIEAVMHGTAVLSGPNVHNFAEAYKGLVDARGCIEVNSSDDIASWVSRLMRDSDEREQLAKRATEAVANMQGALQATVDALEPYLSAEQGRKGGS